jgi:hypothetical protein
MVPLAEQITAVTNAWLPFLFAVGAVAIVIWRAMEWRYTGIIEITKAMHQSAARAEQRAEQKAAALEVTLNKLADKVPRKANDSTPSLTFSGADMQDLSDLVSTATAQVGEVRSATDDIADALSQTPSVIRAGKGVAVGRRRGRGE